MAEWGKAVKCKTTMIKRTRWARLGDLIIWGHSTHECAMPLKLTGHMHFGSHFCLCGCTFPTIKTRSPVCLCYYADMSGGPYMLEYEERIPNPFCKADHE